MGEQNEEDVFLSWTGMFSDAAVQPTGAGKLDEKTTSEANFVVVAGMKFSSSELTSNVMASASKLASVVLDDIAHKNAGVDRSHLQSLQEGIAIQLKSSGDRTDKVKALAEVIDGLRGVENAASALKNVSNDLGWMEKSFRLRKILGSYIQKDKERAITGDFKVGFEEDDETLMVCIENIKHTLENEYATVFVQLRQASVARDFFCVLNKTRKCALSFNDFDEDLRLHVSIRPVPVTLPAMLDVLAESFEAKKRLCQADALLDTIIVAKDATKKTLIAQINKLRVDNEEKDRMLDEAHAEIEVLKEQLKGWHEEVIGISERIKLKAMPSMRRVLSTSNVSTTSTANFSDFEKIYEVPASDESATDAN